MQEFFLLLRSLEKPAEEKRGSAPESLGTGPEKVKPDEREWKAARRKARVQLRKMEDSDRCVRVEFAEQLDEMRSTENLALNCSPGCRPRSQSRATISYSFRI
jgi:hypothetical protein